MTVPALRVRALNGSPVNPRGEDVLVLDDDGAACGVEFRAAARRRRERAAENAPRRARGAALRLSVGERQVPPVHPRRHARQPARIRAEPRALLSVRRTLNRPRQRAAAGPGRTRRARRRRLVSHVLSTQDARRWGAADRCRDGSGRFEWAHSAGRRRSGLSGRTLVSRVRATDVENTPRGLPGGSAPRPAEAHPAHSGPAARTHQPMATGDGRYALRRTRKPCRAPHRPQCPGRGDARRAKSSDAAPRRVRDEAGRAIRRRAEPPGLRWDQPALALSALRTHLRA